MRRFFLMGMSTAVLMIGTHASGQTAALVDGGTTTLFFGATARSLPAGHGYFTIREFLLPSVQFGVTDRFSFGAGTVLVAPGRVVTLTPKYEIYRGASSSVAAGMLHAAAFGTAQVNVVYAVGTRGSEEGAVSGGVGFGTIIESGHRPSRGTIVMIGGQRRLSARTSFVTENYAFPEAGGAVVMFGVRRSRGTFAVDVGTMLAFSVNQTRALPAPIINMSWGF